ncbi:uncharacterized protein V2V93DRAFT_363355 [Kockiozyma suomiensis]|uniref:uncharacterized protein n=1 Tax=Kockiozyma suomiensis TaxID=1337062 RepID=UPI0033439002
MSTEQLSTWANLHSILISDSVQVKATEHAGLGLFYNCSSEKAPERLLEVPRTILLTASNVRTLALSQKDTLLPLLESERLLAAREVVVRFFTLVLHKFGEETRVPQSFYGPYLALLPDPWTAGSKAGVPPMFWDEERCARAIGTSLYAPLRAKQRKLRAEFEELSQRWQAVFVHETETLAYEEYIRADWLVSSRVIELPSDGVEWELAVVPILDFANHGSQPNARYENTDDSVELVCAESEVSGSDYRDGAEIVISYGPDKGSSELLFTYGFLLTPAEYSGEEHVKMPVSSGGSALQYIYGRVPLVEIHVDAEGSISWECEYLWLLCVGPDDGFEVSVSVTHDSSEEIDATVAGETLVGVRGNEVATAIRSRLAVGKMAAVLMLRRVLLLEQLTTGWLDALGESEWDYSETPEDEPIATLRQREERVFTLLLDELEERKQHLAETPDVLDFLAQQQQPPEEKSMGAEESGVTGNEGEDNEGEDELR